LLVDGWATELLVSIDPNYLELPVDIPKATFEDFVDWEEELTKAVVTALRSLNSGPAVATQFGAELGGWR
jgi:hypothetical protein